MMTDPENDFLAELRAQLSEIEKHPDMVAAQKRRERSEEMVANEVQIKLKALSVLNIVAILVLATIILLGVLGYIRLLYAIPGAIAAFILIKKIGKKLLDGISIARIKRKAVEI